MTGAVMLAASQPPRRRARSDFATHTVAPGETMIGIAKRYNVPLKDLAKANRIEPHTQVKMGDRLVIPGRTASAKPPALRKVDAGAGAVAV